MMFALGSPSLNIKLPDLQAAAVAGWPSVQCQLMTM